MSRGAPGARARIPEDAGNALDALVDDEGAAFEADVGDCLHGRRDCDWRANSAIERFRALREAEGVARPDSGWPGPGQGAQPPSVRCHVPFVHVAFARHMSSESSHSWPSFVHLPASSMGQPSLRHRQSASRLHLGIGPAADVHDVASQMQDVFSSYLHVASSSPHAERGDAIFGQPFGPRTSTASGLRGEDGPHAATKHAAPNAHLNMFNFDLVACMLVPNTSAWNTNRARISYPSTSPTR
jgi:hypothetical protein